MPTFSPRALVQAALLVGYVLICHFAVIHNRPDLQLLALLLLSTGIIYRGLIQNSVLSWGLIALVAALALWVKSLGMLKWVLYLPPIVLPLILWSVFFRSLAPGQTPLITAIAVALRGDLSPELRDYTRAVTVLWSGLFAALALGSALLPILASVQVWSLFTNCLNYVFIAALFVLEFMYRQWRFRDLEHDGFWGYLAAVIRVDVRQFK